MLNKAGKSHSSSQPTQVFWEITRRCDARCLHCYNASSAESPSDQELTTEQATDLIDTLASSGPLVLILTGGEPLLRPDWPQLVDRAVARGLLVTVVTNGSSVDNPTADTLAAHDVMSVTISLDSHQPELHDRIRCLPGLHSRALGAIRRLVERKVRTVVSFTPFSMNWRDARGVVELAYQMGVSSVCLSEYVPAGRGVSELALSEEELAETRALWRSMAEEFKGRITLIADPPTTAFLKMTDAHRCSSCGAGREMVRVTPEGTVTPCPFFYQTLGSLRHEDTGFHELAGRSAGLQEARARTESGDSCSACGVLRHFSS